MTSCASACRTLGHLLHPLLTQTVEHILCILWVPISIRNDAASPILKAAVLFMQKIVPAPSA